MAVLSSLVLVGAMTTASPEPAEAYTWFRAKQHGKVVPQAVIQGTFFRQCVNTSGFCTWTPTLIMPQNKIARSSASKTMQWVTVTWSAEQFDAGAWRPVTSQALVYTIPKGKSYTYTYGWDALLPKANYVRAVLRVNWKNSKGKTLGAYRAVFNEPRDYYCVVPTAHTCYVADYGIYLRTFGT